MGSKINRRAPGVVTEGILRDAKTPTARNVNKAGPPAVEDAVGPPNPVGKPQPAPPSMQKALAEPGTSRSPRTPPLPLPETARDEHVDNLATRVLHNHGKASSGDQKLALQAFDRLEFTA